MPDYLVHAHVTFNVSDAQDPEDARQIALLWVREHADDGYGDCGIEELESFIETDDGSAVLLT